MSPVAVNIIGYLAPAFLALSFLFKDLVKLRIINSIGCSFFVVYGLLIAAYPIVVANVIIIGINVYQLVFNKGK